MSLGIRVSQVGEHISLGIRVSLVEEHISLGIRVSQVGERISVGICISQVSWIIAILLIKIFFFFFRLLSSVHLLQRNQRFQGIEFVDRHVLEKHSI